jgi:hypothetical protein
VSAEWSLGRGKRRYPYHYVGVVLELYCIAGIKYSALKSKYNDDLPEALEDESLLLIMAKRNGIQVTH